MATSGKPNLSNSASEVSANPGYALGRIARALATSQEHEDPDTRAQAEKKIEKWTRVYEGMLSGALQIGSRTPVADTPPWATLEVTQGGFTTGELLAGGALQPHEEELLSRIPAAPNGRERAALNSYYLGDEGIAELRKMLVSGCYRVNVPEEGALLVVAWLLEHSLFDQARAVLDEIGPFLSQLRFYPIPSSQPLTVSSVVHLQDVAQTVENLKALHAPEAILALREAIRVWAPLCDRVVDLFVETVEGAVPSLRMGPDGKPLRSATGQFLIEGGWPCQLYANDWKERARAVLEDYHQQRKQHQTCGKPESSTENFARLRGYLETCIKDPRRLSGRDVGMIRAILAGIATNRGLPGSRRCQQLRKMQTAQTAVPMTVEFARVLIGRLALLPPGGTLDSLDAVMAPVTPEEAEPQGLKAGLPIPESLGIKLQRCLAAPVETLVELGVVPSGEILARVIPQITAQVRAAGLVDAELRRLYGAIYQAFRRRRSLLLLNLESQVKLGELPWVQAMDAHRQENLRGQEQAQQTLEQVVVLALSAFPQQILPNKLLQELRALAQTAELKVPLVDEVAADIFMGTFSEKFLRAAQTAAEMLEGTLYERYYGLSYARVRQIDDVKPSRYGTPTSPEFIQLCVELAGGATTRSGSVAHNGKIIEQEQILTTHNLAVLFEALGLTETLRPRLVELAHRCFEWICRRQQQKIALWKARLQMIKNTAYAWRQMIFFLALLPRGVVEEFLSWAAEHLGKQRPEYQARFRSALEGVGMALPEVGPDRREEQWRAVEACRFLGWTTEKHWLLQ